MLLALAVHRNKLIRCELIDTAVRKLLVSSASKESRSQLQQSFGSSKKAGFKKTKPTRKPGLTKKMKEDRLQWCLAHQDWTLEDQKRVIWSDETAVVLHRRGGYRIWRTKDERFIRIAIRERWKGYSEFMFWGCFSYDKKRSFSLLASRNKTRKRRRGENDYKEVTEVVVVIKVRMYCIVCV